MNTVKIFIDKYWLVIVGGVHIKSKVMYIDIYLYYAEF